MKNLTKVLLAFVLIGLLGWVLLAAPGCAALQGLQSPAATYVSAERETYNSVAPIIQALADTDPSNDPDLSGVNGQAVLVLLESWNLRISAAEKANATTGVK